MELEVHELTSQHVYANCGPVVMRVIDGAPTTRAEIDRLHLYVERSLARYPAVGLLVIAHHGSSPPSMETRRYTTALFSPHTSRLAVVYVLLGLGFWASLAISASRSIGRLTGSPALIERDLNAGAELLGRELVGIDPGALVGAHDELVRRVRATQ